MVFHRMCHFQDEWIVIIYDINKYKDSLFSFLCSHQALGYWLCNTQHTLTGGEDLFLITLASLTPHWVSIEKQNSPFSMKRWNSSSGHVCQRENWCNWILVLSTNNRVTQIQCFVMLLMLTVTDLTFWFAQLSRLVDDEKKNITSSNGSLMIFFFRKLETRLKIKLIFFFLNIFGYTIRSDWVLLPPRQAIPLGPTDSLNIWTSSYSHIKVWSITEHITHQTASIFTNIFSHVYDAPLQLASKECESPLYHVCVWPCGCAVWTPLAC